MSQGTVMIMGTVGQRITFRSGSRYVTLERTDGYSIGSREYPEREGFTPVHQQRAGRIHVEHIIGGTCVYSHTYVMTHDEDDQMTDRQHLIRKAKRHLGLDYLPWSRAREDKRSPHWIKNVRPHWLKRQRNRIAAHLAAVSES